MKLVHAKFIEYQEPVAGSWKTFVTAVRMTEPSIQESIALPCTGAVVPTRYTSNSRLPMLPVAVGSMSKRIHRLSGRCTSVAGVLS